MNTLTKAAQDVLAERARQVNVEGWTPEHDDQHGDGSLALAAACYAAPMAKKGKTDDVDVSGGRGECPVWRQRRFVVPFLWPDSWHGAWWKPGREADLSTDGLGPVSRVPDRRRDLVRAAALLLAEIERLDRARGVATDQPGEANNAAS